MSLRTQFTTITRPNLGVPCSFQLLTLEPDDAAWLTDALNDHTITSADISRTLRAEGHNVSDTTVRRHRRQECRCESR